MANSLLVLTDLTTANHALAYAAQLAQQLGTQLLLLHVQRDSVLDPERLTGKLPTLSEAQIRQRLQQLTAHLPLPVTVEVAHGRVPEAVAEAVRQHRPELVVLDRPDFANTPEELVQTTALDLLRRLRYPLLVVPTGLAHAPLPRRVLLAVDGQPFRLHSYGSAALQRLLSMGAELSLVHITPPTGATPDSSPDALEDSLGQDLDLEIAPLFTCVMAEQSPAQGILRLARPTDYDLVVLVTRARSFLGQLFHQSVTAQVLLASPVPLLLLPAE